MTWYLATPFMAYLRYFASRNNYDTKLFPMYGVIYGDSNGGKTTFIKFLVKLMCGETVKMNTTEDFTATRIDGLKRVCEGLPLNIDDLAKTQLRPCMYAQRASYLLMCPFPLSVSEIQCCHETAECALYASAYSLGVFP